MKVDWKSFIISMIVFILAILFQWSLGSSNSGVAFFIACLPAMLYYFSKNCVGWKENLLISILMGTSIFITMFIGWSFLSGQLPSWSDETAHYLLGRLITFLMMAVLMGQLAGRVLLRFPKLFSEEKAGR